MAGKRQKWLALALAGVLFFLAPAAARAAGPGLNSRTANLNVLFLGADRSQLLMASVFSINHREGFRSAALFFPVQTLLEGGEGVTLADLFRREGAPAVARALAERLQVDIAYYVRIDRRVLDRAARFVGPLVLDGREIPLGDLFTLEVTPADGLILGQLMAQFTRPSVYFWHLPALVLSSRGDLETDFPLTTENLWLHYRIARGVDTGFIPKQVAPGRAVRLNGKTAWRVDEEVWRDGIYRLTAPPGERVPGKEKAQAHFPRLYPFRNSSPRERPAAGPAASHDLLPPLGLYHVNAKLLVDIHDLDEELYLVGLVGVDPFGQKRIALPAQHGQVIHALALLSPGDFMSLSDWR